MRVDDDMLTLLPSRPTAPCQLSVPTGCQHEKDVGAGFNLPDTRAGPHSFLSFPLPIQFSWKEKLGERGS